MTTPYKILQQDAIEFLESQEFESLDLVITDSPYESLEKYRKIGTTTRLKKKWFDIFPNYRLQSLFLNIYRVLKKNTHFYFFCDSETMFIVKPIAENVGFKFWKPIVWDKVNIGMGYHYRARYEFILFFEKGKRKLNNLGIPDILTVKKIIGGYPTEKPVQLLQTLIKQSSERNEVVCDPFMGSGSTGVASLYLKRRFLGCDTSLEAIQLSESNLQSVHNFKEMK
jgi:site-specific DNA-methyltransferase (adenine-specific)